MWPLLYRGPGPNRDPLPGRVLLTGSDYSEEWVNCMVYDHFCVEMSRRGQTCDKAAQQQWWCAEVHADGDKRRAVSDERVEVFGVSLELIRDEFGTDWEWAFALPVLFGWLLPEVRHPARVRAARRGAGASARNAVSQSGNASTAGPDGPGGYSEVPDA